jgi:hydroxymethylbilane synthase
LSKTYKVGTRGSLLALTQCSQIVKQLKVLTGDHFDLEIIKTQGDQNTTIPLWQMEGQNFFTKELDQALIEKKVDLVVHSYKDLGSVRPEELELAAVTKRSFPHDILLIKKETLSNLKNLNEFVVGTSSPRRIKNTSNHLKNFLPAAKKDLKILTENLRGNVNSRLAKLKEGKYHAILLALAGLERLADSQEIKELLNGMTFMVLPLSVFPTAASQGALAIEILKGNVELLNKVRKVQDFQTLEEVQRERKAFNDYGGGCHLAVGISVKKLGENYLHFHQGELDNEKVSFGLLERTQKNSHNWGPKSFVGMNDPLIKKNSIDTGSLIQGNFYVTSPHCLDKFKKIFDGGTIWAAGAKTMQRLAKEGYWVNGCADSMGDSQLIELKKSKLLSLMMQDLKWKTLTSATGTSSVGEVVPSYEHVIIPPSDEYKRIIETTDNFYWASFFQYQTYLNFFPQIKDKNHCCGLGKTYMTFQEKNIEVTPFLGPEEFYEQTR